MAEILTPDLCVVGAGAAGLAAATMAVAMGARVILVERAAMGGDSLHSGALPLEALLMSANAAHAMRTADRFGVAAAEPRVDFARVVTHLREVVASAALNASSERLAALGVRVIRAAGRFAGRDILAAGDHRIKARRFILATGSSPVPLAIPGLELVRPLFPEHLLELAQAPTRLLVLGGDAYGVAYAQAFRRLGCDVVVLDKGALLPNEDEEMAQARLTAMAREGVALRPHAAILRMEPCGAGLRLFLAGQHVEETIDGSHLLLCGARRANVAGLGLEASGVVFDGDGVKVGSGMQTANHRIFAIGAVLGGSGSIAQAGQQARLALGAALLGWRRLERPELTPRVAPGDPEIATVGLDEAGARAAHRQIKVLRWPAVENDRARAERTPEGLIKVVTAGDGRILGAAIACRAASEIIAPWALAVAKGFKITDMAQAAPPYPSRSELSQKVAALAEVDRKRSPWPRLALRIARRSP